MAKFMDGDGVNVVKGTYKGQCCVYRGVYGTKMCSVMLKKEKKIVNIQLTSIEKATTKERGTSTEDNIHTRRTERTQPACHPWPWMCSRGVLPPAFLSLLSADVC